MPSAIVVNPNTSDWMTKIIDQSASGVFEPPWKFDTRKPSGGMESIETLFESSLAVVTILDLLGEMEDSDGVVVACFSDPGLFELREILDVPVVGIAESGFLTACMISFKFGVLGGSQKDIPWMESLLWKYGLEKRCSGIQPMGSEGILSENDPEATRRNLLNSARLLVDGGAECLILGCAGWGGHRKAIEARYDVPVIDPVEAACWQLRALVEMGLRSARNGLFSKPEPKQSTNMERVLSSNLAAEIGSRMQKGFAAQAKNEP